MQVGGSREELDNQSSTSSSGDGALSNNMKTNPRTLAWLEENFESSETGCDLPREVVYKAYQRFCESSSMDCMNQATFGKTVRHVFPRIKARRLGVRGQSKYHYHGLKTKPDSKVATVINTFINATVARVKRNNKLDGQAPRSSRSASTFEELSTENLQQDQRLSAHLADSSSILLSRTIDNSEIAQPALPQALLSEPCWNRVASIVIKASVYPITTSDVQMFRQLYSGHCEAVLEAVGNLKFSAIENLWSFFWRARYDNDVEKLLSYDKFYLIIGNQAVQDLVMDIDVEFFNSVLNVLVSDVLKPIPSSVTQAIRDFAKRMEGWVKESMTKMPRRLVHLKLTIAKALALTLRRYTSLNHLAQAARTVFLNSNQTSTMLNDLSRLDIQSIFEQGSVICPSVDLASVTNGFSGFKALLSRYEKLSAQMDTSQCGHDVDLWAVWVDEMSEAALAKGTSGQQLCQIWSYFSSLIIRELTLRSAPAFGSFHLVRLLLDDYLVLAVEQRSARLSSTTPLQMFYNHLKNLSPVGDRT
ncbi:hypothetical protein RvY_01089 [Ramazzottius varieornatus]|uniref:RFX-type winged-helix domain-containing protein n=1 Tax=Ramazzottius varieornatus TaxID=947166 RepID=A0A1D1UIN9_RAMVA|nr:hypothetical protein RvY_01089 [Ramazzottius varieornatus]